MKERTNQSLRSGVRHLLPWLWMAAGYILDIWFELVPGRSLLDSDMASEMILSDMLNKEGSIISRLWYYSTEIRVVSVQWVYRLTLLLFPHDWHLARTLGMAIMLALFAGLMYLLGRSVGLGQLAAWMAAALLWPFGRLYLVYATYGGHYLVYTFLYVVSLTLVLFTFGKSRKTCLLLDAAACVVAMLSGMNGIKTFMVFQVPFILTAFLVGAAALNSCGKNDWRSALHACSSEVRLFVGALATTAASFAGYVVNAKVLANIYSFKSFGSVSWNRFWLFTLDRVIMDFFHLFGYQDGVGVFHFSGIASGVGLLVGAWLTFCIVRLTLRYKKLNTAERTMLVLLVTMIAVCGISYTYFSNYCLYFWLTCMPVAFAVMAIEIKTEDLHLPGTRVAMAVVLSCALTFCSVNNVRQEIEHPTLAHIGLDKVADWLVDNGYKEGYSTFWNGNAMTEMTSGKLDVWVSGDLNVIGVDNWLQPTYHLERAPEKPFLLIDTETDGAVEEIGMIRHGGCSEVYNDGRYVVYAFDSTDAALVASSAEEALRANQTE